MTDIVNERLCVNDNVIQMANEIMAELKNSLKTAKCYVSKERLKIIKKGNFIYNTNGKLPIETFNVQFVVYLYNSEKDYHDDNKIDLDCETIYEKNMIILHLAEVNGVLTKESIGNLEHELNHMLQDSFGQKINETLYDKVVDQCYNSFGLYQKIAFALYMSFNSEISSFTVQYYTFLKNNKVPIYDIYYSFPNDENNPYNDFLKNYNYVISHQSEIMNTEMNKRFGITKREMLSRLENAKKRYRTKIMKAITRYRDELNDKYTQEKIKRVKENHSHIELHNLPFMRRQNFLLECYNKGIHEEASEYE